MDEMMPVGMLGSSLLARVPATVIQRIADLTGSNNSGIITPAEHGYNAWGGTLFDDKAGTFCFR